MSDKSFEVDVQRRVDELGRDYKTLRSGTNEQSLALALEGIEEPHRPALFRELIAIEFSIVCAQNQAVDVEAYCRQFPEWSHIIHEANSVENTVDDTGQFSAGDPPRTVTFLAAEEESSSTESAEGANHAAKSDHPVIDGYEIMSVLGRGGMGVVYKARDERLKRLVALKMILAGEHAGERHLKRFRAEAEAVARLQHPNIVQIHDVGEQDGNPYLSLEFVDGQDLAKFTNGNPQPPMLAAELIESMARAMDYAHQQGVVHRDLKPGNVLLARPPQQGGQSGSWLTPPSRGEESTEEHRMSAEHAPSVRKAAPSTVQSSSGFGPFSGNGSDEGSPCSLVPKITDFGLAKQMDVDSEMTNTGQILGTPSFMAPEQADGRISDIGPLTDVYSLGAILYALLTGRPPFQGTSAVETILMVRGSEPVPPSQLQPGLSIDIETICLKCLQKEANKRYQSAAELADELRRFLELRPILARPVGRLEKLRRWARRNPTVAMLSTACLTLLVVGFGLVAWKWREASSANDELTLANSELFAAKGEISAKLTEVEAQKKLVQAERDEAARQKQEAEEQKETAEEVSEFLGGLFEDADPVARTGRLFGAQKRGEGELTAVEVVHRGRNKLKTSLLDRPRVRAALLDRIGNVYINLDQMKEAEPLLLEALQIREEEFGTDSLEYAASTQSMGLLHMSTNRPELTIAAFEQSLSVRRRLLAANDLRIAESLFHLGVQQGFENVPDADRTVLECLAIRRHHFKEAHTDVAATLFVLGQVYLSRNESLKALPVLREAAAMTDKLQGKNDFASMVSIFVEAQLNENFGNTAKAGQKYEEIHN